MTAKCAPRLIAGSCSARIRVSERCDESQRGGIREPAVITSSSSYPFGGKLSTLETPSFNLAISTAKAGFLKKQSVEIYAYETSFKARRLVAKLTYNEALSSNTRLTSHDLITQSLDDAGMNGLRLRAALMQVIADFQNRGLALGTIADDVPMDDADRALDRYLGGETTPRDQAIEAYSLRIFKQAMQDTEKLGDFAEERNSGGAAESLTNKQHFAVATEFLNFYLNLTDRLLFGDVNEDARSEVMTLLEQVTIEASVTALCSGWPQQMVEKIIGECLDNLMVSFEGYGQCPRWVPEIGEDPNGTLFWEFGLCIANLAGHPMDHSYAAHAAALAMAALEPLEIGAFVERMKQEKGGRP